MQAHLDEPFVIVDWSRVPENNLEATYTLHGKRCILQWGAYDLSGLKGIWYRKPETTTEHALPLKGARAKYAATALRQFNEQLLVYAPRALWISDYFALRAAGNKLRQLEVAAQLGFRVPDTIITSSPAAARMFVERHAAVVVKPIDVQLYSKGGEVALFLTQKVNKHTIDYRGMHLAPAIFQQAIDVAIDIRVTVVGNEAFAATVTGSAVDNGASGVRDWRIAHHTGDFVVCAHTLPSRIAQLCVAHVKKLGLHFGAIDLILDKKGRYWFLENNPNGQWGFVEQATSQPIGKAIATLLHGE